jgi:hypothetical protein
METGDLRHFNFRASNKTHFALPDKVAAALGKEKTGRKMAVSISSEPWSFRVAYCSVTST